MTMTKRSSFGLILGVLLLSAAACEKASTTATQSEQGTEKAAAPATGGDQGGPTIAKFGGKALSEQELRTELDRLNRRSRQSLEDKDRLRQFVENHVLSRLIYAEGEKRGYAKDPEVQRQVEDLEHRLVIQKVM